MKKFFTVFGIAFIGICLIGMPAFGEGVSLKQKAEGKWLLVDDKGNNIGSITKTEAEGFRIENAAGEFGGNIWSTGNWTPPGAWRKRRLIITPETARLYIDALEALRANKIF
jgi:hypothetical protein